MRPEDAKTMPAVGALSVGTLSVGVFQPRRVAEQSGETQEQGEEDSQGLLHVQRKGPATAQGQHMKPENAPGEHRPGEDGAFGGSQDTAGVQA